VSPTLYEQASQTSWPYVLLSEPRDLGFRIRYAQAGTGYAQRGAARPTAHTRPAGRGRRRLAALSNLAQWAILIVAGRVRPQFASNRDVIHAATSEPGATPAVNGQRPALAAATLVVVRDSPAGIEVLLSRRAERGESQPAVHGSSRRNCGSRRPRLAWGSWRGGDELAKYPAPA